MRAIFTIINQKGGVGKSTTAHALGAGLRRAGFTALSIDLDPQANLSYAMGASPDGPGAWEVLQGQCLAQQAIQPLPQGDLIAAAPTLSSADLSLIQLGKEYRLRDALSPLLPAYDYLVIDTPPSLGILSINALTAASDAIVPVQADIFSLQGVGQLAGTFAAVRQFTNPGLNVAGLLLTRYSDRTVLSRTIRQMAKDAAAQLGSTVFDATIREAVAVREAQISQSDLFAYAPDSNVAQDYDRFIQEVLS